MTYVESQIISRERYLWWLHKKRRERLKVLAEKAPEHITLTDILALDEDWDLERAAYVAASIIEGFRQ